MRMARCMPLREIDYGACVATGSSGGSAAAGGFRFETQVGALLAVYTVSEHRLWPELTHPWPRAAGWPTHVGLQSGFPVDDVMAYMQDSGLLVIQAKKGLRLSASKGSPLADALRQAVRMFRSGRPAGGPDQVSTLGWNPDTDRIVIATDAGASHSVREHLVKVVARLATAHAAAGDDQLANSQGERDALQIFTDHVRRLWDEETGSAIEPAELRAFCSVVRVMRFDLQPAGPDLRNVRNVLSGILIDRTQVDTAWTTLLSVCQDLAADRQFVTAADLRGILAASRIGTKPVEHSLDEVGPVFAPETVLHGPVTSGLLRERMTEADELMKTDPRAAGARYASVMAELETSGYSHVAAQVQPQLTRALRAAGQHRAAVRAAVAAAWRPVRLGEVPSSFPEAWMLEEELRKSPDESSRGGRAVVAVLRYEAGDEPLVHAAEQISQLEDSDEHAGELLLWLAEEAIAARQPDLFRPWCDRALALAVEASADDAPELAGRLRIAVAECRNDWASLLATIEADCGAPLYVLALARQGQALAWSNDLQEAISSYEEAITHGIQENMFAEARTWLYDLRSLRAAYYGPGLGHDPHFTAQSLPTTHKTSVFAGEERLLARGLQVLDEGKHERAHSIFMRLQHRMAAGAALSDQRQGEAHRGATLTAMGSPDAAVGCYLRAGDHQKASTIVQQQPDTPVVPDPAWFAGPVWQTRAAYEFLGDHGDLVPEQNARQLFDELARRLVTGGRIYGWSNFQANETLLKPLAALVWASPVETASRLLEQLAPLAERGGIGRMIRAHVDLVLGCARVHPSLVVAAARQFADLAGASEQALPRYLEVALQRLAPAGEYLSERLSATFVTGKAPWLASVLVVLGVRLPAVVDHVNEALDRAARPREYLPHAMSFGSDAMDVAMLSHAGDADRRDRFLTAMIDVALEQREPYSNRREAIDAIAVIAQQRGATSLGNEMLTKIRNAIRPLANGKVATSIDDDIAIPWMGSPATLMLAATRLLLILSDDHEERSRLIRTLLLTLMDEDTDDPRLLSSALAQAPAEIFQHDLLVLAVSRSPVIRALAARRWAELPETDHDIGRRLATDPAGAVRQALAHGLTQHDRPDAHDIRTTLNHDCRFTVRAAIQQERRLI